ncbi:hypothetical protein Leryth_008504 [Lithospermum erythrorhizon]|nr:hypothetical protein Leryth_008504 [Lithospermum erythrorhizon]
MANQNEPVTSYPAPNQNQPTFSRQPPPSSATIYPYVIPPGLSYAYYNQQSSQQHDSYNNNPPRSIFLRPAFSIIIGTIMITMFIVFIIWLVLRPKLPVFHVISFSISAPFNLTNNSLSTSWDIGLIARNPNAKITLYYDDVQAGVFYRGGSLADTYLSPFVQGRKNESRIKASFAASQTFVYGDDVAGMKAEQGRGEGNVAFNVRLVADLRFKAGIWRARRRLLKVYCGDLVVFVGGNGSRSNGLVGGPKQCTVG